MDKDGESSRGAARRPLSGPVRSLSAPPEPQTKKRTSLKIRQTSLLRVVAYLTVPPRNRPKTLHCC